MRLALLWICSVFVCVTVSTAQSTRPVDSNEPWTQTVRALADSLVDSAEPDAISAILPPATPVRRFDRVDPEDRLSLREMTAGATVVAALSYRSTPTTMASDLSDSLRNADFVPDAVRAEFLPSTEKELRHANDTATQWISTALQPGVEQPVGVIVLWQYRASRDASEQPDGELVFVLIKAQEPTPGEFRMAQVIYGNTRQITR